MSNTNTFRDTHFQQQPQRQGIPLPQQLQQQQQQPRHYHSQLSQPSHTNSPVECPVFSSSVPVNFGGFGNHNHHRHQHYGGQETVLSGNQSTQQLSCEELQQQREHAIDHKTKHDLDADTDEGDADHAFAITTATGGTGGAGSSTATPAWDVRFSELKQWKKVHDNTCVPKGEGPLGRWVARQRELKRTNKLIKPREDKLNDIGFIWNTVTAMWDERFRRLCLWRSQHGHCAVPIAQGDLGIWVSKQRQLNKKGKLSQDKIDRLNSLAFTWSTTDADWDDKFKRLNEWRCRNGHCSVPFNEGELGWWVNTQRQCKRKGKLSGSRQKQLDSIGFVWNPSLCSQQLQQQQQQQEQHEQEIGRWEINREKVLQVKEEQEVVLSSGDGGDSARGEGCDVAVKVLCGSGIVANDGKKMMMIMEGTKKSEAVIATTKGKRTDGSGEKHGENPGEEDEDLDEEGDSVNTDNTDNTDDSDDSKDYSVSDNEENSGDDDDDGDDYEDGDNDNHDDDDYNNDDNNEEEKDENVGFKAAAGEEPEEEDNGNDNDNGIGNGNAKGNSDSNGDGEGNANDVKKLKGNESVLAHHHQNENNTKNQQQIHTTEKHEQNPTNINYCKQVIEANNNVPQADNLNPATIHYHQKHDIHHHHHHNHDHHDVNNHTNDDYDNINWGLSLEQQFLPWQVSSRATAGASGSSMPVLLGRDDIDPNASWVYMSRNDNNNCTSISSSERERDVRDDVQIWGSSSSVSDMWSALHASVAVARDNVGVVGNMNAGCGNGNGNGNGNGGCNDEMEDIDDDDRYAAEETWIAEMMEVARREGPF